ncbi:hypothetical protein TNIN_178921, partial [Trichonephila inaurata madagascariensis]
NFIPNNPLICSNSRVKGQ